MIKIINKDNEKLSFTINASESLCNAIRRSANEISILAIEDVEIFKNDSVLYDEVIAHRLGLIPLKTDKTFSEKESCSCKGKGCSKCSVELKLVGKGPCILYAGDLKGKAEPVYKDMPIIDLVDGQEIEIVATARLGKGIEHTKFSPGIVYYRNVAEIEISKDCNSCKKCIEACPHKILKMEKKPEAKDIYKCDLCEACVEECRKTGKDAIKIKPTEEILFIIETYGQIEAKDIFTGAIDALKDNLKSASKEIK